MSELFNLAWSLSGITRTLDMEGGEPAESASDRDRIHGLTCAAHLLSTRLLELVLDFSPALTRRHDEALARIGTQTGERPAEVAARLLCEALEADIARHEAEQAAA
jgi:hypothetical protein